MTDSPRPHVTVAPADGGPYVAVDPAMRSGQPNLNHTRLSVKAVAGMVWVCGVEEAMKDWDLRREDVLVACWYAGTYGLPGPRSRHAQPQWRRRWGVWASGVDGPLWHSRYDEVEDPPMKPDQERGTP